MSVQYWLPPAESADECRAVRLAIVAVLAQWLTEPGEVSCAVAPKTLGAGGLAGGAVALLEGTLGSLGQALCLGEGDLSQDADRAVCEGLGSAFVADLRGVFEAGRDGAASTTDGPMRAFVLSMLDDRIAFRASLTSSCLARLRRQAAPASDPVEPAPLGAAVATLPVRAGCRLGETTLTAGEVAGLAPGDVLVLDTRHADPVPLSIEYRIPVRGTARVSQKEGQIVVSLVETVDFREQTNV